MPYGRYQFGPGTYQISQLQDEFSAAQFSVPLLHILGDGYAGPGTLATGGMAVFADLLGDVDLQKLENVVTGHQPVPGYVSLLDLAAFRDHAKQNLTLREPIWLAIRNALRIAFGAIAQNRSALINLINDYNNRFGTTLQVPPAPRTWQQLLAAVQQQIDQETNPST